MCVCVCFSVCVCVCTCPLGRISACQKMYTQHQRSAGMWYFFHRCPAPSLPLLPLLPRDIFPQPRKPQRHQTFFITSPSRPGTDTQTQIFKSVEAGHSSPLFSLTLTFVILSLLFSSCQGANDVCEYTTSQQGN